MNELEQEAIKILLNFFTPAGNQNRYSVRQYIEFIEILESALKDRDARIADLEKRNKALHEIQDTQRDEIRERDKAMRILATSLACSGCALQRACHKRDSCDTVKPHTDGIIKAALDAAKEEK